MPGIGIGISTFFKQQGGDGSSCVTPVNTLAPVISGLLQVGDTLSCTDGTWTGTGPIIYIYQWKRNNVNITAANANTHVIVEADLGQTITCEVTGINGCGSIGVNSNVVVPEYNPNAAAYFDRVVANGGAALSTNLKALLNQFFIDANAGGYLPSLRLHLYANEHTIAACTNLISNSFTATLVNTPAFTQYNHIQGNGSISYINTSYTPADGLLDDASYGFYQKNNATIQSAGVTIHGALRNGSNQRNIVYPNNTGSIEGNINGQASSAVIQAGQTTEVGQSTVVRISSTQIKGGRNGVWGSAANETSTTLETDALYECAVNNAGSVGFFSNTQMQYSFNGTGWTAAKDLALYNRMQTLLTAIAAL